MNKRIELDFVFKNKLYVANVLIKNNEEGYTYIINLFDKRLNQDYPYSYTFIASDNKFVSEKPVRADQLELINAIKGALKNHPENTYNFID